MTQPGPQVHCLTRKDRGTWTDSPLPRLHTRGEFPMRNLGGFARNRGWGWVLGWPKQQMSALASCTRVVQSKQNNHGAGFLQPRAGPNQGSSPEHGCGASKTEALHKPGFCVLGFPQEGSEQADGSTPGWAHMGSLSGLTEIPQAKDTWPENRVQGRIHPRRAGRAAEFIPPIASPAGATG